MCIFIVLYFNDSDSITTRDFWHADNNLREPDAYENTTKTFSGQSNHGYSPPERHSVIVEVNPLYATPTIQRKKATGENSNQEEPENEAVVVKERDSNEADSDADPRYVMHDPNKRDDGHVNSNPEPVYAAADKKVRDVNKAGSQADPGYATPDLNRRDVGRVDSYPEPDYEAVDRKRGLFDKADCQADPGYATPDLNRNDEDRVDSYLGPGYEIPDVKKKEVNGATSDAVYSVPDNNRKEVDPHGSIADSDVRNKEDDNAGHSTPKIKRIEINGVLYTLPDKSKSTKKVEKKVKHPKQVVVIIDVKM